jgi:hypothetical protein
VRIWNGGTFEGRQVWMGAATHDIGIAFHPRLPPYSHAIDTQVDWEREKIVTDLTFAGCLLRSVYAETTAAAPGSKRNSVITDGRIAVLTLQSCDQPVDDTLDDAPAPPGNKASRFVRRIILESRDYVLRENAYYLAYELVRSIARRDSAE